MIQRVGCRLDTSKSAWRFLHPEDPWDERYISLHEWMKFYWINVGKYGSPKDPLGNCEGFLFDILFAVQI